MTRRILVTGASGDIGEAVGRILAEMEGIEAIGADAGDPWPGRFVYGDVHRLPHASHPAYCESLVALARAEGAEAILPLTEPELAVLAREDGVGFKLIWVGADTVATFVDKLSTAVWLRSNGLPSPTTVRLCEATKDDLPLVVKPRLGSGSRGVRIVEELWELEGLQGTEAADSLIAQDLLLPHDQEVTCAVVRLGGVTRTLQLLRTLSGDLTTRATVVVHDDIKCLLERIADCLNLEGSINVQLRRTHYGPRIFDINPRLSGTVGMRDKMGFCDLRWWLSGNVAASFADDKDLVGTQLFRRYSEAVLPP